MKNQTHPIQQYITSKELKLRERNDIFLSMNEFTDNSDLIGFSHSEPDPYSFLTIEDVVKSNGSNDDDALIEGRISLSEKSY